MTRARNSIVSVALVTGLGAIVAPLVAQDVAPPQPRVDITGDWQVITNEDDENYIEGPELGDYTGLPITPAARLRAESWDASILSQPERQTQAHPVQYPSNNRGPTRITKVLDPTTQGLIGYAMAGSYGRADRIVWLDGRPHPSKYSEHTWSGFSTGAWENGILVITTTHMKPGYIRRNGVFTTPHAKLVEHVFRADEELMWFMRIYDPETLQEPLARSYTLRWNRNGNTQAGVPFEAVDELGDKPNGWVPSWPLGAQHREFATRHQLPFEATLGGVETLYPEYEDRLRQMARPQTR